MAVNVPQCIRTLRLKVKTETYPWLNAAAVEINQVWNWANATSYRAARPFAGPGKWLSGFDLDKLAAGATEYFEHIGSDTIQRVNAEFATRRQQFKKAKLRWRVSRRAKRTAARRRKDALHKFSRKIVDRYQIIVVGDVSSIRLVKTRMAKSVLDAGWGMLKTQLQYKGEYAGRSVCVVSERNTTRTCSSCGSRTGPTGLDMCAVRTWMCSECGDTHDRDVNAAKNILSAGRMPPSVSGNESSSSVAPTSQANRRCESGKRALKKAA